MNDVKKRIQWNGHFVDATPVPFVPISEPAVEYGLPDGARLRMSIRITELYRLDGIYGPDGKNVLNWNHEIKAEVIPIDKGE